MVFVWYVLVAIGVVLLSNKASEYVDLLDKKTKLSGAFIGGIMLSAVTSLPELFTSLSATMFLKKPGLCMGNILGSDLFNIAVLALLILICFRSFSRAKIAKGHIKVTLFVFAIYGALLLNMFRILNMEWLTVSVTSLIVLALYIGSVYFLSKEDGSASQADDDEVVSPLSLGQIIFRFILVSIGIIVLSIIITYLTDDIASRLHLGTGLAGALFLGIATSFPEVSSTIALFRIKNYDIAIGNIVGSNLFNFLIICVIDFVYVGSGLYTFSDPKTVNLLVFGAIATPLMLVVLKLKNKPIRFASLVGIVACYAAFLLV